MAFDHQDPEVQALMVRKGWAQTDALINRRPVNLSPARMREVARQHDPTAILEDVDREDRIRKMVERFAAGLDLPEGFVLEYTVPEGQGRVDLYLRGPTLSREHVTRRTH